MRWPGEVRSHEVKLCGIQLYEDCELGFEVWQISARSSKPRGSENCRFVLWIRKRTSRALPWNSRRGLLTSYTKYEAPTVEWMPRDPLSFFHRCTAWNYLVNTCYLYDINLSTNSTLLRILLAYTITIIQFFGMFAVSITNTFEQNMESLSDYSLGTGRAASQIYKTFPLDFNFNKHPTSIASLVWKLWEAQALNYASWSARGKFGWTGCTNAHNIINNGSVYYTSTHTWPEIPSSRQMPVQGYSIRQAPVLCDFPIWKLTQH